MHFSIASKEASPAIDAWSLKRNDAMVMQDDLVSASIPKSLLRLSLPIFLGMTFQILYGIVDTYWIGKINPNDPSYLGGVGVVIPLFFLVIALGSGVLIGMSSLVARCIGSQDQHTLNRVFGSGMLMGGVLAGILLALVYLFDTILINKLGAQGNYADHALAYLRFIAPAGALMLIGNVFNGIIMGEGRMRHIMIAAIMATTLNCGLDPLFIFALGLGVRGAGLATVASQLIAGIYILRLFFIGKTTTPLKLRLGKVDLSVLKRIVVIGFPQTAGQLAVSVGYFFFNRILIGIDPQAVAAFAVCIRFEQIMLMPILSIGTAVITLSGQNFGAGRYDRVRSVWWNGLLLELVFVSAAVLVITGAAPQIYRVFSTVETVTNYAVRQTRVVAPSYLAVAVIVLVRTLFQGLGKPVPGIVGNLLRSVVFALPAALFYAVVLERGVPGVWFGMVTGNVLAAVASAMWVSKTLRDLS
jgi:putative MATE family efflux protein